MHISPLRLLNRIAAIYLVLFCFVPPMQVGIIYRVPAIAAAIVWVLTALLIDPYLINGRVRNFVLIGAACLILMFLWRLNVQSPARAFAGLLQTIIAVLIALIAFHSFKSDLALLQFLFTMVLALICYYCVTTIIATVDNPYASRIANSEWLENRFEGNENVGLYGYVYMCVFLLPVLQYKIACKIKINRIADVLTYVAVVLIAVMVLLAGYMIAIVCALIGILLTWLLCKPSGLRTVFAILMLLVVLLFYDWIIQAVIEGVSVLIGDNPVYNTKLDGFRVLYEGGNILQSTWYGRIKNYRHSFACVTGYPILGSYFFGVTGGGGHSSVLDTIGKFGWVTAFLYFTMMWIYPRKIVPNGPRKHTLYTVGFVMLVSFGLFDHYAQEISLPIFLMIPYIIFMEKAQKEQQLTQDGEEGLHENSVSELSYRRKYL